MLKKRQEYNTFYLSVNVIIIALTLVWAIGIFQLSSQDSTESSLLSNQVYKDLSDEFRWLFQIIPIRKLAHILVYTVLSYLMTLSINMFIRYYYIWTLVICYIYACLDEVHQIYSPGRSSQFSDTLFDLSGILIGVCFGVLTILWLKKFTKWIHLKIKYS